MIAAEVKLEPCVTMAPSNLSDPRCSQRGAASGAVNVVNTNS